jgi:hypothetical protein
VPRPPPAEPPSACPVGAPRGSGIFVGLASEDVFAGGPRYRSCELDAQRSAGVDIVRQSFDWAAIERLPGRYDFSFYDRYVGDLARHRIRVLPILFNAPSFRTPRRRRRGTYPPRRYSDLGRFGAVLVRRYGPRGSFWRRHRGLPRMSVRAWQIWNEPNLPVYWPTGPSPRQYTRLLKAAAKRIKRADRRAEIVTAGLPESRLGTPLKRFVSGMYRAGAKRWFDTLAINPYARTPRGVAKLVRATRRLMNARGDRRGRIWVTEFGWATGGPRHRFRVSRAGQAARVRATLRTLYRSRRRYRLRGAVYYNWRDAKPYPPLFQDFFGLHTGLLDLSGRDKPALASFRRVARRMR